MRLGSSASTRTLSGSAPSRMVGMKTFSCVVSRTAAVEKGKGAAAEAKEVELEGMPPEYYDEVRHVNLRIDSRML